MNQDNPATGGHSASIWPTAWKYALIIAAFSVLYSLLMSTTAMAGTPGLDWVARIVTVVLLVLALRSYRGINGGYMTFGQGFGIAFVASVVANVIRAAIDAIYVARFGRERLAAQLEQTLSELQANPNMTPEVMEAMRGILGAVFTPTGTFVLAVVVGSIGWGVASLILAAILKRPPPLTD